MKLHLTTAGLIFFTVSSVFGQTLLYDVIRNDESMGVTSVERKLANGSVTYNLNTKTEFRIIFKFEVEYELVESFRDGILQTGTGFNTLNGSDQKRTKLSNKGSFYELIIDGIATKINEHEIKESVSEVYFEEPHHNKKVFSAYFGRYLTFEKVGEHTYKLVSPDGTNEYIYENGICTRVKVSRDFATFSQELKPHLLTAVRNNTFSNSTSK